MQGSGFSGLSYAQINQIASGLRSKAEQMGSLLTNVENQLKKIGDDSTWSGTAAAATFEEFKVLITKFPQFSQAVTSCATYLDKVVESYREVDNAITGK